jgi:hypothetical protein
LLRLHKVDFERAAEVRIVDVVQHDVHVVLAKTLVIDEILDGEHVHAHLLSFLQELLLGHLEVAGDVLSTDCLSH